MRIEHCVIPFKEACEFVALHHRHHKPPQGHKFSIGAKINGTLVGIIIVGRPVARNEDNGFTLEVTRLCTLQQKNINSFLLGKAAAAVKALGYKKLITYTLDSESRISPAAAAFQPVAEIQGRLWHKNGYDGRGYNRIKWQKILNQ